MLIKPAKALAARWSGVAGLHTRDAPHAAFLGGGVSSLRDGRAPQQPDFADAREENLRETWAAFERAYLAQPRLAGFWIAELEDAIVHPPFGIVTVGDAIVRETVLDSGKLRETFPGMDRDEARRALKDADVPLATDAWAPVTHLREECFLLGWGLAHNYFNWTLRYLSKVAQWQHGAPTRSLLAPAPASGFIDATLEAFGVPQQRVRYIEGRTRVDRLTLTTPSAGNRYALSPLIVDALRHHPTVERRWRHPPRALYIPRRGLSMRRVVNEADVIARLRARGLTPFDPGACSIGQQIRAFRDATLVVAPHGAGLTNIVYCAPGTRVVEIVPEGYDQGVTSYRSLADLFGLPYRQMFAVEARPNPRGNRCNSDIAVSIEHLDRLLDQFAP